MSSCVKCARSFLWDIASSPTVSTTALQQTSIFLSLKTIKYKVDRNRVNTTKKVINIKLGRKVTEKYVKYVKVTEKYVKNITSISLTLIMKDSTSSYRTWANERT